MIGGRQDNRQQLRNMRDEHLWVFHWGKGGVRESRGGTSSG